MLIQPGGIPKLSGTGLQNYASVTCTSGAGAYGSWVQVTASAAADIYLLLLRASEASAAAGGVIVDIGTGAAASEVVIASVPLYHAASEGQTLNLPVVVPIAAGTRIAVRIKRAGATDTAIILGYANQADLLAS